MGRSLCAAATLALGIAFLVPTSGRAQAAPRLDLGAGVIVGGEAERYLRLLELSGEIERTDWTMQPLQPTVARSLRPSAPGPWSGRFARSDVSNGLQLLRPSARLILNSAFPVQEALGPTWSGRGATISLQAGAAARWGRLSLQLAPVVFLAQNADFPLASNGTSGSLRYADSRFPFQIDNPQRFGTGTYGRVDPGTSSLDMELPAGLAIGLSSAPVRWGPALEYPLLLGPNAGGFPHYYAGTGRALDLWVVRVKAQLIGGWLSQSEFSTASAGKSRRFASAVVASAIPRGVPGLELGVTRMFESNQPFSARRALQPVDLRELLNGAPEENFTPVNQLASAFFRWVFPDAGAEVYGEWLRDDFPGSLRKLLLQPDDISTFTVGMQRVLASSATSRRVIRFEIVNGELTHNERGDHGALQPLPPYVHYLVVQGHTQHGLILGSPEAYGGAGWRLSLDHYSPRGRTSFGLERTLRFDWLPGQSPTATDIHPDVMYALRANVLRFSGSRDYGLTLLPAIDLNRNLERGADRLNLHAVLSVSGW